MGMERNGSTASNDEDSMSDWSDEEAARLSNLDRDTREESQWVCDQIASALRSAFHRGKVEGMRDAAKICEADNGFTYERYNGAGNPPIIDWRKSLPQEIAQGIRARATALEQENKD
jgi:hypothetical protein